MRRGCETEQEFSFHNNDDMEYKVNKIKMTSKNISLKSRTHTLR